MRKKHFKKEVSFSAGCWRWLIYYHFKVVLSILPFWSNESGEVKRYRVERFHHRVWVTAMGRHGEIMREQGLLWKV